MFQEITLPPITTLPMLRPTIYPTPSRAGERFVPT